jgi:hypothetical protein
LLRIQKKHYRTEKYSYLCHYIQENKPKTCLYTLEMKTRERKTISNDAETLQIIEEGKLNLDEAAHTVTLFLTDDGTDWEASILPAGEGEDADWCQARAEQTAGGWTVTVMTQANKGMVSRRALLRLTHGSEVYRITIYQEAGPQMVAQRPHIDVTDEGGYVYITLQANTMPEVETAETASWLKYVDRQVAHHNPVGEQPVSITFRFEAERNTDWGRMARVTFKAKGARDVVVDVHQWCRPLQETESIHVDEPGQLATLIGGNVRDWANINSLKLSGTLNATDMQVVQTLLRPEVSFAQTNDEGNATITMQVNLHLQHLDLRDCKLVAGRGTYSEPSVASSIKDYRQDSNELGQDAFLIARTYLQSVVLPKELEKIGEKAFYMCLQLERVEIPASVKTISGWAFANCEKLTTLTLPADSKLETLGSYALATGSTLDDIYFPSTLRIIENQGILGHVSARRIHLKWTTPPVLERFGVSRNATLCVPLGTAEAYRNAKGWNRAKEIVEE